MFLVYRWVFWCPFDPSFTLKASFLRSGQAFVAQIHRTSGRCQLYTNLSLERLAWVHIFGIRPVFPFFRYRIGIYRIFHPAAYVTSW